MQVVRSHLDEGSSPIGTHFLGAVVFELKNAGSAAITTLDVIDGQQRLTTLQLLLDAVRAALLKYHLEEHAERLRELTVNSQSTYKGTPQRFKLWPSQANRLEFQSVMDPSLPMNRENSQIEAAHDYFRGEAIAWLGANLRSEDDRDIGLVSQRASELTETLASRLVLVAIDLTGDDDAQLIFETLNDRGTPLLKADLIKNWIFRQGEKLGANTEKWSSQFWDDFDTEWWREEIPQGRLSRSRVDIFLHYWLTMRLQDEVKTDQIFRTFMSYVRPLADSISRMENFLSELRVDADTYRGFGEIDIDSAAGRFRARVIEGMELAATTPILLWMISQNHGVPDPQIRKGLAAFESWAIRRSLLQMPSKDLNKMVVSALKRLKDAASDAAGECIVQFLADQTANAREWPSDTIIKRELPRKKLYGLLKQNRIVIILQAIEEFKRLEDPRYGSSTSSNAKSIEHIMPKKWRDHWMPKPPLSIEEQQDRDVLIHTLGNLTLVNRSLNSSLSNRPWTDLAARGLSKGGKPGKGKWSLLDTFSLEVLNKEILVHKTKWGEEEIESRSLDLAEAVTRIWPDSDSFRFGSWE